MSVIPMRDDGLSLKELCEITDMLGKPSEREHFKRYGPTTCPQAPRIRKDLDFRITRAKASDSVLISVETSPAGLINLVSQCWKACMGLLAKKGIMCRGYIKRGPIYPQPNIKLALASTMSSIGKRRCLAGKKGNQRHRVDTEVRNTLNPAR